MEWRALSLDDLLAPDHRVRLVWAFVERLDLGPLDATIKAVAGRPGHPPADPRVLLALWLYATIEGIGSARALARYCREHVAFQWLRGGVGVNHKTLADFRVGHGALLERLLERLLVDGFAALLAAGVASLERVARDGVRVRASAGAASFRRRSTLAAACRLRAEQRVERLRAELDADPGAASRRRRAARERAAAERRRRVEAAPAAAGQLEARRAARAGKDGRKRGRAADVSGTEPAGEEARASTTDPAEARVMRMADGGWRPAYNAQFAADTRSGLIAGVAVDNLGSDMGKLAPMSEQLAAAYGVRPREHPVDGGFARLDDIAVVAAAGVTVYAPVPQPRDPGRDPHIPPPGDPPAVAEWRRRMGTEAAKAIYRERAATAERVNAQARNRGLIRLLVRGADKVKAVLLWYALAHNMARLWRLAPA